MLLYSIIVKKMKALLVIAVMTCVFVVGQAQNSDCLSHFSGLNSCTSQLVTGGGDFCNNCANQLIDQISSIVSL